MPVIDFKEIPEAHLGGGHQDTFEQFTAEFLQLMGFTITDWPSRGADGGKDLIVEEVRKGVGGETRIRHLVSCKHKAFSGTAVSTSDENNITDRVKANKCQSFIGVYSTIPSSGLATMAKNLKCSALLYDGKRIERELLTPAGLALAKRYFPASIAAWTNEDPKPVPVFGAIRTLECDICQRNLLDRINLKSFLGGVLGYCIRASDIDSETGEPQIVDLRWYCKVKCMGPMEKRLRKEGLQEDGWDDIHDYLHPARFIMLVLGSFENIANMSPAARDKFSHFVACTFQHVARGMTSREEELLERMKGMGMAL